MTEVAPLGPKTNAGHVKDSPTFVFSFKVPQFGSLGPLPKTDLFWRKTKRATYRINYPMA